MDSLKRCCSQAGGFDVIVFVVLKKKKKPTPNQELLKCCHPPCQQAFLSTLAFQPLSSFKKRTQNSRKMEQVDLFGLLS